MARTAPSRLARCGFAAGPVAPLHVDASTQLFQIEGLGEVIVGPFPQQHGLVGGGYAGGDDDDGKVGICGANGANDLLAGSSRQHEIGDNQIGAFLLQHQKALGAREGLTATIAAALQMGADYLVDGGIVLDDEYVCDGFHSWQDNTRVRGGGGIFKQS